MNYVRYSHILKFDTVSFKACSCSTCRLEVAVDVLFDKYIDNVYVSVENHSQYGWRLRFCPPFAGAASLSVKVDGKHLR